MATDWVTTLQEQADFATQIAEDVKQTLKMPDLTATQASRLYRVVEQGAQSFDRIIDEMEQHDIESSLTEAADTIADMWTSLSIATANRLRALQGLKPIEFPSDESVTDSNT
ncbi:hypothetical protein CU102_03195 [Phyllobacterium brassicacearum]|uniref:Uncharacterized protein n=1 Tax=Phyllobacterium brassicacearum TaxID=314235 RepID=A0A2P7BUH1_9HYPH|nr:hypothetical protein [Phyllobacterium brassicacearum]PSH70118.1 hypothetical protein CU102_03195 [Phyllobacterium brassicacearum]TDQ34012.1 hypothetical protein DEV91_104215 [Phyllobacterium brassicacearum]